MKLEVIENKGLQLTDKSFAGIEYMEMKEGKPVKKKTKEVRELGYGEMQSFKIWKNPEDGKTYVKIQFYPNSRSLKTDPHFMGDTEIHEVNVSGSFATEKGFKIWWNNKMHKPEMRILKQDGKEMSYEEPGGKAAEA